jgi:ubiquinone/menaquinone biosynthesis C-methylase UbiE
VEGLSAFFNHSRFDLVNCTNALDHSADPMAGILEMLRVVKVDRTIVLRHVRNEAENENYSGFHQHNFDLQGGKFIIWNKQAKTIVDDNLPVRVRIETDENGWGLETRITKLNEFPDFNDSERVNSQLSKLWGSIINFLSEQALKPSPRIEAKRGRNFLLRFGLIRGRQRPRHVTHS